MKNLVEEAIRQTIVSSFDTHSGPLINASIIKKDLQNHVCVINMHHVISDGWSINLLVADLWQFLPITLSWQRADIGTNKRDLKLHGVC